MIWYFAYGSNLWIDQMIARTGPLHLTITPRVVRLPDHQLAFNNRGRDGQYYANLRAPGNFVLGVIYWCPTTIFEKLDPFEEGYHRERRMVVDRDGTSTDAFTYVSDADYEANDGIPSVEYVQRILRGGRQHGLSETYLRDIEALSQGISCM